MGVSVQTLVGQSRRGRKARMIEIVTGKQEGVNLGVSDRGEELYSYALEGFRKGARSFLVFEDETLDEALTVESYLHFYSTLVEELFVKQEVALLEKYFREYLSTRGVVKKTLLTEIGLDEQERRIWFVPHRAEEGFEKSKLKIYGFNDSYLGSVLYMRLVVLDSLVKGYLELDNVSFLSELDLELDLMKSALFELMQDRYGALRPAVEEAPELFLLLFSHEREAVKWAKEIVKGERLRRLKTKFGEGKLIPLEKSALRQELVGLEKFIAGVYTTSFSDIALLEDELLSNNIFGSFEKLLKHYKLSQRLITTLRNLGLRDRIAPSLDDEYEELLFKISADWTIVSDFLGDLFLTGGFEPTSENILLAKLFVKLANGDKELLKEFLKKKRTSLLEKIGKIIVDSDIFEELEKVYAGELTHTRMSDKFRLAVEKRGKYGLVGKRLVVEPKVPELSVRELEKLREKISRLNEGQTPLTKFAQHLTTRALEDLHLKYQRVISENRVTLEVVLGEESFNRMIREKLSEKSKREARSFLKRVRDLEKKLPLIRAQGEMLRKEIQRANKKARHLNRLFYIREKARRKLMREVEELEMFETLQSLSNERRVKEAFGEKNIYLHTLDDTRRIAIALVATYDDSLGNLPSGEVLLFLDGQERTRVIPTLRAKKRGFKMKWFEILADALEISEEEAMEGFACCGLFIAPEKKSKLLGVELGTARELKLTKGYLEAVVLESEREFTYGVIEGREVKQVIVHLQSPATLKVVSRATKEVKKEYELKGGVWLLTPVSL